MQIKPFHFYLLISFVLFLSVYSLTVLSIDDNDNTKTLERTIQNLKVQIDSINTITQSRLDSVQIITEKKTEIKNYYTQKFYEIDSLHSDTSLVRFIREQLQNLRTVKQLHN